MAKCGSSVVVFTIGPQIGTITNTFLASPQILTLSIIHTRIGTALLGPDTSLLCVVLGYSQLPFPQHPLSHLDTIHGDVLDAANELFVGALDKHNRLGVDGEASEVGHVEGRVGGVVRVDGVGPGVDVVQSHDQMRGVESHINLLPLGIVQIISNRNALKLLQHT